MAEGPLNQLAEEIHRTAVAKGWWEEDRNFGEVLALMHSELSEALEEWRDGRTRTYFNMAGGQVELGVWGSSGEKPEGLPVELVDCVIRIFDFMYEAGHDIDQIMRLKVDYNKTRPYRHGGKLA